MPEYLSNLIIKIGGQQVSELFADDVLEVVVDSSLQMPDMFTIELRDPDLAWVDDSSLDIGKEVEISAECSPEMGGTSGVLIKGEIAALQPRFSAAGTSTLLIRGYDKSHRLHRGRKTRTFLSDTDSGVVQKVAQEAGLTVSVDSTSVTYDYIVQNNQTDMEFIQTRADRLGYQVTCAEGQLYFKKGDATLGTGPELTYLEQLIEFEPSWTGSGQAGTFVVTGWDQKKKEKIKQQATASATFNQGGMTKTGAAATSIFGEAQQVVSQMPVSVAAEATAIAEGMRNDAGRAFVRAEGLSEGNPGIKAGYEITVTGVGTRFSGKYRVSSAIHTYKDGRYQTHFTISGRHPHTLAHLLSGDNGQGPERGLIQGVVPALVTNLSDPDDLGRVKVKFSWMGAPDTEVESFWVRIAAPMAGAARGMFYLPEVNDEVLVAFEHGDPHRPYIVGSLWSQTDAPPKKNSEAVANGKVNLRVLKTRAGHIITLDDTEGAEKVEVQSKSGHLMIMDDKSGSEKVTIKDKTGKNSMEINSTSNSMTIQVDGDFSVTAKGKINLTSTQDMTLKSSAKGSVTSNSGMTIETKGNASIKGMQTTVEGQTAATLKGLSTTVDGTGMTTIKGGLVKIN